jgi:DNA-directed RNA polymerase specialized sigma24 family protein
VAELVALPSAGPSPSESAVGREVAELVARATAALPPPDRDVIRLRLADGLAFDEVGRRLGVEPAAARKRFGRALIRLQLALTEAGLFRQ